MHPFSLSLSTTFKHMPPAPVPISGKQNLRNEDQSWELWAAGLWHHFGSRKYRRSLWFHTSLPSPHKILPVTLCPEDVCCLKAVNGPSKKHSSCTHRVHRHWGRELVPSVAEAIKMNSSRNTLCRFLLSSANWSLAKVPHKLQHIPFHSTRGGEARMGRDCPFGKPDLPQSDSLCLQLLVFPAIPSATPIALSGSVPRSHRLPHWRSSRPTLFIVQRRNLATCPSSRDSLVVAELGQVLVQCWF